MRTSRRAFVVRRWLLIGLGLLASLQTLSLSAAAPKRAAQGKPGELTIKVDTSQSPEIAAWAAKAKTRCEQYYPTIVKLLGADPRRSVTVTVEFKQGNGVAGTSGTHIGCNTAWFTAHPDDEGALIHEFCHIAQAYDRPVPGWVTEGIADYVRWFQYEPAERRPQPDPNTAQYTDGYQTTAAFFDWIVRTKNKSFIVQMNRAAKSGKYNEKLFKQYAKKPLDDLWTEYIESLKKG